MGIFNEHGNVSLSNGPPGPPGLSIISPISVRNMIIKTVSNIWVSSDTDWKNLNDYRLNIEPMKNNMICLDSIINIGNNAQGANIWFRWRLRKYNYDPVSGAQTNQTITYIGMNTLTNIGNRFNSAFGAQLDINYEAFGTVSNKTFYTATDTMMHEFILQVKITDGGSFSINRLFSNSNSAFNSYTTSSVMLQEIIGLKLETNQPAGIATVSSTI